MRAKRFISIILSLLIICSSFAGLTVFADEANKNERTKDVASVGADISVDDVSATSGETGYCEWSYDESTNTLTISGDGEMGDYSNEKDQPWYDFRDNIKKVVIENGVTSIGSYAFSEYSGLTNITISDSVTSIGPGAFYKCIGLTSVTIGNSVKVIGGTAFLECTGLTDITIPDSVEVIAWYAFNACTNLEKIEVDDNNQKYSSLNGNLYDKSQSKLIQYAIGKKDESFTIPSSVISIEEAAFEGCTSLTSVTIPDSVTSIGYDAFGRCTGLTSVTIGNGVTCINYGLFDSCTGLASVTIPNGVTSVEDGAFRNCTGLTDVYYGGSINEWVKIAVGNDNECLFKAKIHCAYKALQEITGFESKYDVTFGDKPFNLNAKAETALSYSSDNKGVADVSVDGTVTIKGAGTTTITITAEGSENYESASATVKITVGKASQEVTGFETKYDVTFGDESFNLNAKAKTALTYVSNNTSVAKVSADGTVTIKGAGSAIITITAERTENYNSATATVKITVGKASQDVTGFESKYDVKYGDKPFNLNAKAETALSYVSDNTSVADVSADGTVTIKGVGSATITITAERTANYNSATATVEITVGKAIQKVSVSEKEYELTYGAKPFNLGAKADTTLTYVSNNLNVADVSADGTVIIKGAGTANIIIIGEETENYTSAITTVKITVGKSSQEVTGFESKYDVKYGDKPFNFNAKAETALSYVSDNTSVAEVSTDGTVTIKGGGTATITITAEKTANYKSATATVEITVGKSSQKVTGFESKYDVTFGDKPFSLNAKAETALSYVSDNTSVAEVSTDGTVTIKGAGTATITITAEETANYKSATATVEITVGKASQKVTGFEPKYDVKYGDKPFNLNAKAETALSYVSDNTSVADVSADGTVTIKGAGSAIITITAERTENYNSATATVKITVGKASQDVTGFESKYDVKYGDKPFNLNAKAETALSYVSDNTSVADVSADGTVTIKGVGNATITITAEGTENYESGSATVEIIVNKSSQKVTGFESKYDVKYGDKPFNLNAKAETALSYVSDNTSVAEVSADGTVTIKGAGKATITITAEETTNYNSATATVEITVGKASQKVTGFEPKYDATFGDKPFSLNAKAETALTYVSDNTSVAEVLADGTVTIKGAGKATITITAEETANYNSATATVEITVNKASQIVSVSEKEYELTYGAKPFNLGAKADTTLTYVSNNLNVAEVSADGTVTIKGAGTSNIIIIGEETENYTSAITTVKIIVNKTSPEITGFETSYKVKFGDKPFNLNTKAETALLYASDNTSVAEVSSNGTVTIKNSGTASIMIIAKETANYTSATATVKITVAKATQKVTGVKSQYVTSAGKSFSLNAKAKSKLTYTSSNKNVAVVSSTGKVTVKAGGYAYITVKASDNGNYKSAYVKTKIISAPRDFTSKDISKVKKTGTTKAKITWKSLAGATGYTVQMATNKTFKGAKTVKNSKNTATLTGLKKGKTYYVRISAYTKVSGKNYANKWYTVKFKM